MVDISFSYLKPVASRADLTVATSDNRKSTHQGTLATGKQDNVWNDVPLPKGSGAGVAGGSVVVSANDRIASRTMVSK